MLRRNDLEDTVFEPLQARGGIPPQRQAKIMRNIPTPLEPLSTCVTGSRVRSICLVWLARTVDRLIFMGVIGLKQGANPQAFSFRNANLTHRQIYDLNRFRCRNYG